VGSSARDPVRNTPLHLIRKIILSTGRTIDQKDGLFFITFTCYKWLPLFELCQGYHLVYDWFEHLIGKGHQIAGYVIMPNHLHALIGLRNNHQTVNKIVSNGKRFMAYGMIKLLKEKPEEALLHQLSTGLSEREKAKGQKHRVFESGFDVKLCESTKFIEQKLNYIHMNPCSKKWQLVENPLDYKHSSKKFYETYRPGIQSKLTPYTALFEGDEDVE